MELTALDILVLLVVGGAALLGLKRGFVTEVLSLMAWIFVVFAIKLFHTPVSAALLSVIGTSAGAATLAVALIAGVVYFLGRMVANGVGTRTRTSILGPVDRALGFGFGAVKGLILCSLAFLLLVLVIDTLSGGPKRRPEWITQSRTYLLLDTTSRSIADLVDRRRRGEPMFGGAANAAD
jgi:membrane protein required for colicin V production